MYFAIWLVCALISFLEASGSAWVLEDGDMQTIAQAEIRTIPNNTGKIDTVNYNIYHEIGLPKFGIRRHGIVIKGAVAGVAKENAKKYYSFLDYIDVTYKTEVFKQLMQQYPNFNLSYMATVGTQGERNNPLARVVAGNNYTYYETRLALGYGSGEYLRYFTNESINHFFINAEVGLNVLEPNVKYYLNSRNSPSAQADRLIFDINTGFKIYDETFLLVNLFNFWQINPSDTQRCNQSYRYCDLLVRNTYDNFSFGRDGLHILKYSFLFHADKQVSFEIGFSNEIGGALNRKANGVFIGIWKRSA